MKTRSYQELHDYIFGSRADIEADIQKLPEEHRELNRKKRHEKIKNFFFEEKSPLISLADRKRFRTILRAYNAKNLESILYGEGVPSEKKTSEILDDHPEDVALRQMALLDDKEKKYFAQQFYTLAEAHSCFFDEKEFPEILKKFQAFYRVTIVLSEFVERNVIYGREPFERAFKMCVVFGDQDKPEKYFHSFEQYLKSHNLRDEPKPLHDALVWELPTAESKDEIHLTEWRHIIQTSGARAFRLFARAKEIEAKLGGKPPADYKQALDIAKEIAYKRAAEYPEFAEICMHYDFREGAFNQSLDLLKLRKVSDNLPDVVIDGSGVGHPGYYLVKLPIKDPRAFILGHITNCCQSIGGDSSICVIDGLTRANNGFYVLLKEKKKSSAREKKSEAKAVEKTTSPFLTGIDGDKHIDYTHFDIVGQGYAWLSLNDNLTFDSWENLRSDPEDQVIANLLTEFAKQVTSQKDANILQVTIGTGGKTPQLFSQFVSDPETMTEGTNYGDSNTQYLVYLNEDRCHELLTVIHQELLTFLNEIKRETKIDFDINNDFELYEMARLNRITTTHIVDKIKIFLSYKPIRDLIKELIISEKNEFTYLGATRFISHSIAILADPHPLHAALDNTDKMMANFLLDTRIGKNTFNATWLENTPIILAIHNNLDDIVDRLIKMKEFGDTYQLFQVAIYHNNLNVVKAAIAANLNIKATKVGYSWLTPLSYAIEEKRTEIVAALIEAKAELNACGFRDLPLISRAIELNNPEIVNLLLAAGAKIKITPNPLVTAISFGNQQHIIDALLTAKADLNGKDAYGFTPLIAAVYSDNADTLNKLLAAKANLNDVNNSWKSALHLAVEGDNYNFVKILMRAGASTKVKMGASVINVAKSIEMRALLTYRSINTDHIEGLKNCVKKIAQYEIENKTPYAEKSKVLINSLGKIFVENSADDVKLLRCVHSLREEIVGALQESILSENKIGQFKFNPYEINYFKNIYSLLTAIEKNHSRDSLVLPANKFGVLSDEFSKPLTAQAEGPLSQNTSEIKTPR